MHRVATGGLFALLLMGDAHAATEPEAIEIFIPQEHKEVISALLKAVEEGTTVTGIAEFDSLSATYGLIGVYGKGRTYA